VATPEQNNCPSGSPAVVVVTVVVAMVTHVGVDVTVVFGDIVVITSDLSYTHSTHT
jgi:uroporphyrinogen-III decarboxylase